MEWTEPVIVLMAIVVGALVLLTVVVVGAIVAPSIPVKNIAQMMAGVKCPPILVAFVRRLLTVVATAAVTWVAHLLGVEDGADLVAIGGAVAGLVEMAGWGLFDQVAKSGQNAVDPKPVAGSNGGNPAGPGIP